MQNIAVVDWIVNLRYGRSMGVSMDMCDRLTPPVPDNGLL